MLEFWTFGQYPLATIFHWIQGIICGVLIAESLHRKHNWGVIISFPFIALFLAYEISEMADIHDHAYIDIFNFGVCLWAGAIATAIVKIVKYKIKNN